MSAWQALGWIGNTCFFSRFFVQWWLSERARKSVAPPLFWSLSLAGTLMLGPYALHASTHVLLVGYVLNGLIYARNLRLRRAGARRLSRGSMWLFASAAGVLLVAAGLYEAGDRADASSLWIVVGGVGQALWSLRFVVQWWASERAAISYFPAVFWWLSLIGNVLLLAFTIHLGDPVLIAGYVPGPIVQVRNLMLGFNRPNAGPSSVRDWPRS